jgi:hypothetical protein
MARYFFRANYRGTSVNDDVGEEFSTLRDAEAHAAIVANELVPLLSPKRSRAFR